MYIDLYIYYIYILYIYRDKFFLLLYHDQYQLLVYKYISSALSMLKIAGVRIRNHGCKISAGFVS